jgi:hypothetical protein
MKLERRLLARSRFAGLLDTVESAQPDWGRLDVTPVISAEGQVLRCAAGDVGALRDADLDVIVHCGACTLAGPILGAARQGVLSIRFGDLRTKHVGPPGFWEVYHHSECTEFSVERHTEESDGGTVIFRGTVPTRGFALLNRSALWAKSVPYLTKAVAMMAEAREIPELARTSVKAGASYRLPRALEQLRYSADLAGRLLRHRALRPTIRWQVAFRASNWRAGDLDGFTKIPNPPGHFLADPFVVERNGQTILYVEDQLAGRPAAFISAYRLSGQEAERLGPVIVEPFHLSFPYLFEFGGELYMVPESGQARQVRIYRCTSFPMKWELAHIALEGVDAVDSMIFERHGRWWMLTNLDQSGANEHCSELHLFHAEHPLTDTWLPASRNPVVTDASRARNGGLLRDGDDLYRVGQRQGFDSYGTGFGIYRISSLGESRYEEVPIAHIRPTFIPGARRTHHCHGSANFTVIDFATYTAMGKPEPEPSLQLLLDQDQRASPIDSTATDGG